MNEKKVLIGLWALEWAWQKYFWRIDTNLQNNKNVKKIKIFFKIVGGEIWVYVSRICMPNLKLLAFIVAKNSTDGWGYRS